MAEIGDAPADNVFPSAHMRALLSAIGLANELHSRSELLALIARCMEGWTPSHRPTDQLAQIVLNLGREGKLMEPSSPAPNIERRERGGIGYKRH
jgi:hypothetical protein